MGGRGRLEQVRPEIEHAVLQLKRVWIAVERDLPDEVHRRLFEKADEIVLVAQILAELLHEGEFFVLSYLSGLVWGRGQDTLIDQHLDRSVDHRERVHLDVGFDWEVEGGLALLPLRAKEEPQRFVFVVDEGDGIFRPGVQQVKHVRLDDVA